MISLKALSNFWGPFSGERMNTAARETASSLRTLVQLANNTLRAVLSVLRISKTVLLVVALIASRP